MKTTCTCFRLPRIHPYERACSDYADEQIRLSDEHDESVRKSEHTGNVAAVVVSLLALGWLLFSKAFWQ